MTLEEWWFAASCGLLGLLLAIDFARDFPFLFGTDESIRKEYQKRIDKRNDELNK